MHTSSTAWNEFQPLPELLSANKFPKDLAQRSIQVLPVALGYLHECHVVHAGELSII